MRITKVVKRFIDELNEETLDSIETLTFWATILYACC